ncbi:AAA family ATPase [Dyadobacter helix]|nr:ATP-binding protein [Dyadobacter sp. CECT 9275]
MLVRFVVSNFLSFDSEVEFNMLASSFKGHKHHVYRFGKVDVLRAAAIYGANGAGKSNLIKAIEFLQNAVELGGISQSVNDKKFKLKEANKELPMSFELEVIHNKKIYSYGVSFNRLFIVNEWLYEVNVNFEDKLLFERSVNKLGRSTLKIIDKFNKTPKQKLLIELMEENLLKPNELFLGKADEIKIKEFQQVRDIILNKIVIIHPGSKYQGLIRQLVKSEDFHIFTNNLLKSLDTGVVSLGIEEIEIDKFFGEENEKIKLEIIQDLTSEVESVILTTKSGDVMVTMDKGRYVVKRPIAEHLNGDNQIVPFVLNDESDGTQRLLDLVPAVRGILKEDITFFIDEIDQSLHTTLLKALIDKVLAEELTRGQIIFTTHESNLLDLDIFRQDEIWFAEKNAKVGNSQLYSLSEFKPRYDLDIRKGYLKGRFGAIPFVANLDDLNWDITHA